MGVRVYSEEKWTVPVSSGWNIRFQVFWPWSLVSTVHQPENPLPAGASTMGAMSLWASVA